MQSCFENPFADYGGIVYGGRFIGRYDSLKVVESRIVNPCDSGNLAIIGVHRIGKSSLAYKAIMEHKEKLLAEKKVPIWVNIATHENALSFFRSLVSNCYEKLVELNWLTDDIKFAANNALQDNLSWTEGYRRIKRFFEKVRKMGIRVIFILDEFDHARHIFRGDISGFQGLRELSYHPDWRVSFITTSRRSLYDIELQTQTISTLDGIFHKHYLGMFNEREIHDFFGRLFSVGVPADPILKEKVRFYCGGHPYLLEMLGYEIVESFMKNQYETVDVERDIQHIEGPLFSYYEHLVSILSEKNDLSKLLQILFGPVINVKRSDIEEFLRYGLIQPTSRETYKAFSEHFHMYLKLIERQVELWPVWRETERTLRSIVTNKLQEKYGEQWVNKVEKSRPNLKHIFDKCRAMQIKEEKAFGIRASLNLIDFTYPKDLFDIIFAEWGIFQVIFGRDKNYWDQRAQLLAKVRNPLAHNRDEILCNYEIKIAEGYCKEILAILGPCLG